jgi:CHAT domain-containing protein
MWQVRRSACFIDQRATRRAVALTSAGLSGDTRSQLALLWGPAMVRASDLDRHRDVVDYVGQVLHDQFFCRLAHWIPEQQVGQVIFVPDMLTRHLPLHLARVCSKDIVIPDVSTEGAEYFCEVLPVEYAPCVQAVALSQHQRRPPNIARVASFSDAQLDLPGARYTGAWLGTRISKDPDYLDRSGADVTRSSVEKELRGAELVLIGTHGIADESQPENSGLQLHDGLWTATDIAALPPLEHSPAVILAACEVAAANPGDNPAADGVPGALLTAGAAFVLGSRWPGEDVSMGILIERFLHHTTSVGLRPAAVLFRAIRDLRRTTRQDALTRCRDLLEQMKRDGFDERMPDVYTQVDWFALQLEAGGKERPFEAPFYWGGVVVVGSGWSGVAGGLAAGQRVIEGLTQLESARAMLAAGDAAGARDVLSWVVGEVDGVMRVQALELMAVATAESTHPACDSTSFAEARAWLDEAMFVARAEQRPQLLRNVEATRAKLALLEA